MDKIKVSIIIPVYNLELYIGECLNSVVNQTLKHIEIIIINDGSTDSSFKILEKYKSIYNNIIIVNQENKGQSIARNIGMKLAKGEYIYFLDGDDIINTCLSEEFYEISKNNNLDILTFDGEVFYENDDLKQNNNFNYERASLIRNYEVMSGEEYYQNIINNKAYRSSPCLQFFKTEFLRRNNIYFLENIIHEDELYTTIATIMAQRILYSPKKYFYRRVRKNSTMTIKKGEKNIIGYLNVAEELYKFYKKKENSMKNDTKKLLLNSISNFYSNANYILINEDESNKKWLKRKIKKSITNKKELYNLKNLKLVVKINLPPRIYKILKLKILSSF